MYPKCFLRWTQRRQRQQVTPARRALGLPAALLLAVVVTGAAFAATSDPNWIGTVPQNVSNSTLDRALQPDLAVDASGEVAAVWSEDRGGRQDIFAATNLGAGAWSVSHVISSSTPDSKYPDVLAVGNQHFVAWVEPPDVQRVYEKEIDGGNVRIILSPEVIAESGPRLAASEHRLHMAFGAGTSNIPNIFHASRWLTSTIWLAAKRVYTSTAPYGSHWPAMAAGLDGQTLHLVWQDKQAAAKSSIKYMSGTVQGTGVAWASVVTLSTGIVSAIRPEVAVDSAGTVHVVWGEGQQGTDNYIGYTRYAGGTWSTPVRIDPDPVRINVNTPGVIAPSLALWENEGETTVCVAWYGYRTGDPAAEEVLLRCSYDGGTSWTAGTVNVSRSTSDQGTEDEVSISPAIAFGPSGQLHVVWQECTGSITTDYEIYHAFTGRQVYLPLVLRNG